jgi:TatA/E family protein of Tat protein translocase
MGSLGLPEIIFILLLALLIFGPKRLPEIGRTLGKGMAEFRKASNDLKRTINAELALDEDEQSRHPRRFENPVTPIVQALAPPPPEDAPAGTVAQAVPEVVPPAYPNHPADFADTTPTASTPSPSPVTEPHPIPTSPIEPS